MRQIPGHLYDEPGGPAPGREPLSTCRITTALDRRFASPARSHAMPSQMLHRNLVGVMMSLKGQTRLFGNVGPMTVLAS